MSSSPSSSGELTVESGHYGDFRYQILDPNSTTATIRIEIPQGQSVKAIPGCMFATSKNIQIKGKFKKTFKALFGPDDARFQTLSAVDEPGWVLLAPSFAGSITPIGIKGDEVCVSDKAFLASIGDIESTIVTQAMHHAIFSANGLFVKKVKGTGVIFVCAVGSMMTFDLKDGEEMIVDYGHLVTWPRATNYGLQKAAKTWFGSGMSGEGIVANMKGPAKINVQTRNPKDMAEWVYESKRPA